MKVLYHGAVVHSGRMNVYFVDKVRHEVFHGLLKHLVYDFIIVWTIAIAVLPGPRFVKRVVSFGVIFIDVIILVRSEKLDIKWTILFVDL